MAEAASLRHATAEVVEGDARLLSSPRRRTRIWRDPAAGDEWLHTLGLGAESADESETQYEKYEGNEAEGAAGWAFNAALFY